MHKVNKITIQGFRRLRHVEIKTRPFMVMIGANGVGKSSVLDAVALLSRSADGRLNQTLNDLGGIVDISSRGSDAGLTFGVAMGGDDHAPLDYQFHLQTQGQSYEIACENLTQCHPDSEQSFKHVTSNLNDVQYYHPQEKRLIKLDWNYNHQESALSQVPKMYKQPEEVRCILSSTNQYHLVDVGKHAPIKLPQQMKPIHTPGGNGEDLVAFLYTMRESHRDYYEMIEDSLRAAFPEFEMMNFPPVAAGMLSLTWQEKPFRSPLYMHQLSDGMLRFLWLISLLQSPALSSITMIDEPEVSLHPEQLRFLADLMREASTRTQMIVATHSDRLIRFLEPHEVLVLDVDDDGYTTATWGDEFDLEEWLKEYSLDEVWRMGLIGGRP